MLLVFVAVCSDFSLFWLRCQYLPSDYLLNMQLVQDIIKKLARKIPLRKPNRDEGIVSIKPRLNRAYD